MSLYENWMKMALQTEFTPEEKEKLEEMLANGRMEETLIVEDGMSIAEIYGDLGIDLGRWGLMWAEWMTANRLVRAVELMQAGTFDTTAIKVNEEIMEFLELLEKNWRERHPRPTNGNYLELVRYEQEAKMYPENYLMHEESNRIFHER